MATIVILAAVALFVGLRLYSVLGERTGHEQQPILKPAEADRAPDTPQPRSAPVAVGNVDGPDMAFLPTAGPAVRALLAADNRFDVARFLDGAKGAYRMILEAYWKSDIDSVKEHIDANVYETFSQAIAQREKDGVTLDNRLVAIDQALISEVELDRQVALLTVRFESDIAAVTRDKDGNVVAGSMSDAVQTRDLWTFRRDLASTDPNWLLVETDEEA